MNVGINEGSRHTGSETKEKRKGIADVNERSLMQALFAERGTLKEHQSNF